ncbi:hypothetical protein, partial [Nitrosopumilus sp. SJ]|uniref:hypothetical protein n=1 Tax=Nitrosopumilus sp. SJ TaxID=1027374 RepID=UPI0012EAB905
MIILGLGAHVAALLVFGVVLTLFGISINGDLANIFSETDPVFFLLSVFILSLFVILKLKTKIQLEINSKVLTAFLCMVLLSSTFTGFANFSIAPETFAEEITNSTATDTVDDSTIDTTNSTDSSLDPLAETVESTTSSNSTAT